MRRWTRRWVALLTVAMMLGGTAARAEDRGIDVQDNRFAPATVTVAPGDTVTWTQSGSNPHSVTADDGSFDSHPNCPPACMGNGDTFSHTFDDSGEFGYHCKIHGSPGQGMSGTVVVEAAGEPGDDQPDSNGDPNEPGQDQKSDPDDESGGDGRDRDRDDEPEANQAPGTDDDSQAPSGGAVAAEDDSQALPHTGGVALLPLIGLVLLAGGGVMFRRRRVGG